MGHPRQSLSMNLNLRVALASLALILAMPLPGPALAFGKPVQGDATFTATPDNYRDQVRQLQPGDHLRLAAGIYPRSLRLHNIKGTPEAPIVISGPSQGEPAVFHAHSGENTISLGRTAHVTLRHLTLDGRGRNAAGVVLERDGRYAHHITLEHLTIQNYDASQGHTGITTRAPAWDWIIRNNHIHDTGTGLYLGQPDGSAPFIGGLIENNAIQRTLGYNMQIKHQEVRDPVPGIPTEPRQTTICYNTFSKAARSNGGDQARPNLLVGHWPPQGPGQNDRYLIYGNLFHENPAERLFQGEGNVALYNNVLINHLGDGVILQPHNDRPGDIWVLQNTVVARGFGIRIHNPDQSMQQIVAGNAVFANPSLDLGGHVQAQQNLTAPYQKADTYLIAPYEKHRQYLDARPRRGALELRQHLHHFFDLPHLDRDHTGRPRLQPMQGAHMPP